MTTAAQTQFAEISEKFAPLGDRLLIVPDEPSRALRGIIIPDSAKKAPATGKIASAGPALAGLGEKLMGCRVIFRRFAGQEVTLGGTGCIIVRFGDILALVEE